MSKASLARTFNSLICYTNLCGFLGSLFMTVWCYCPKTGFMLSAAYTFMAYLSSDIRAWLEQMRGTFIADLGTLLDHVYLVLTYKFHHLRPKPLGSNGF